MADPVEALLEGVVAALNADAAVHAIVPQPRILSDWGVGGGTYPLIRISMPIIADWEDSCGAGSEIDLRVHCFTKGQDAVVTRDRLAAAVRTALDEAALTLAGNDLRLIDYSQTIRTSDPDDPTIQQAVVRFTAVVTASP